MNTSGNLLARLRGQRCRPYNSDTKIRVRLATQTRFYYPDVSIICRPNPQSEAFQDEPIALFEVLSKATRRIDVGEKKDAYLTIPSLSVYALIEQETALMIVFRRTGNDFVREVHEGLDAALPLPEVGIELPFAEVYDTVEFTPEPGDEAEV
jgi:Uma2 family endonuclease